MIEDLSCVYWIHLSAHTDMFSEGYIGITSHSAEHRYKIHKALSKKDSSKQTIYKAIRKYGEELILTTLLKGSMEYCMLMEFRLRSIPRIGWNIVIGGKVPPTFNRPHTDEAKKKIGEVSKQTAQSLAHKAARLRKVGVPRPPEVIAKMLATKAAKGPLKYWTSGRSNKDVWLVADQVYQKYKELNIKSVSLSKLFGYPKDYLNVMVEKFIKDNWIPLDDPEWVLWAKTYKFNKEIQK